MRYLLLTLSMLFSLQIFAQGLSGVYASNHTTFEDELHPENSFKENHLFHIALDILNNDNGMVGVQSSKAPSEVKFYEIESFVDAIETEERQMVIYHAHTVHLPKPKETRLVLYFTKDGSMNLMINHPGTSQVYHNLKRVEEE